MKTVQSAFPSDDEWSARQRPPQGSGQDLMSALKLAVHIGLDEIRGYEFCAMLTIAEERDPLEGKGCRLQDGANQTSRRP